MTERNRRVAIILAVIFGGGIVMCLVCGALGAFQSSRWFGQMVEQGQRTVAEADAYAASHDDVRCLDEGFHRSDACEPTGISCFTQVSVFMDRCIQVAPQTPGFCDGVPPLTEIMLSSEWARETCTALGRERDPHCPQLVQAIQRACARRTAH